MDASSQGIPRGKMMELRLFFAGAACRCDLCLDFSFLAISIPYPSIPPVTTDGSPGGSEASKRFEGWSDAKEMPSCSNREYNTQP